MVNSEAEHFHVRADRRSHRDLRLFRLLADLYRSGLLLRRCFFNDCRLVGQRFQRRAQLLGQTLQQLALGLHLRRGTAGMRLFKVNDAVIANLTTTVQQTPLRIEDRRLVRTRVQASDRQQHLHIRTEAGAGRSQDHALAVQAPCQLANQQLINISGKTARPTTIRRRGEAAIVLPLQQRLTLQVVGDRYRTQHYSHTGTLLRLSWLATVKLIQGDRLVHAAPCQAQYAREQENKWKAQKSHHPIQAATTRHRSDTHEFIRAPSHAGTTGRLSSAKSSSNSSVYARNVWEKPRSRRLERLLRIVDQQRIDPLEAARQFVATASALAFVMLQVFTLER